MTMEITSVQKAQEVSAMLAAPDSRILAGGTSYAGDSGGTLHLIDISGLEGLDEIRLKGKKIVLGPLATLQAIADSTLLKANAPALADCAARAAAPEIRERATIGGNLALGQIGDLAVPLLAAGAQLTIKTDCDYREVPLSRFWDSDGANDLNYDEWINRISFQVPEEAAWGEAYAKSGEWDPRSDSSTAAAIRVILDKKDKVTTVRGGLRAGRSNIRRMFPLEKALKNKTASDENLNKAALAMAAAVSSIRPEAETAALLKDMLERAVNSARERRLL